MSFFYLSAVKGDMLVHILETIITKRLEYLKALIKRGDVGYNEYVVEGGVYDNVGHFMLCVISILSGNTEFSQFIYKAEVELFKKRLVSLTAYELRSFAKKLLRNITKYEQFPSHISALQVLCQHLILKVLAQHICSSHRSECDVYHIKFCFKQCLSFVAKREVELKNGAAFIPCGKWKQYLIVLFSDNLKYRLQKTDLDAVRSDPRIMQLLQKITQEFFPHNCKGTLVLLSKDVDNMLKHFPPCMLNLHQSLRKKHRLSHFQRFYYSLFLKDIGMPVEEAVHFWKEEYRQMPNGSHSCGHNWEKDEKKYLYGIRHMYGLEGGRKSYTSVNCKRIQSIDNACTEGGCPFKSFEDSKMLALLRNPSEQLVSQINELRSKNQFTNSCMMYLKSLVKTGDCDDITVSFTPVRYYTISSQKCTVAL